MTSFWKKIDIQYYNRVGIRVDLENATVAIWNTINDATVRYGTSHPLGSKTEVRSNSSDGFVDWIELVYVVMKQLVIFRDDARLWDRNRIEFFIQLTSLSHYRHCRSGVIIVCTVGVRVGIG